MIIIIRALPQWGKDDGDYDSPISRDETSDFTKRKKIEGKKNNNEKGQKEKKRPKKKKKKGKKGENRP